MAFIIENGFATTAEGADPFITGDVIATGAIHWVDSVNGDDGNAGTEGRPLATLAQAITNATASNGDIIVIKSGHTETVTTQITIDKAGLKIYGIGNGSLAPNFICAAGIDCIEIREDDVELNNLYFPAGTIETNDSRIHIISDNVRIKGCTFKCGAYDEDTITVSGGITSMRLESISMTVTADGPRYGVAAGGTDALFMKDCAFDGGTYNWSVAAIHSSSSIVDYHLESITLTNEASIAFTNANAKGVMSNIIAGDGSTVQV